MLLEWTNEHCGYVELIEYFLFDYLHVAFGLWIETLYFFKLLDSQAHATVTNATVPPPLLNPKTLAPYLRHHPFAVETKGRRSEERREEKLGHVVIDPRRSSPKIG